MKTLIITIVLVSLLSVAVTIVVADKVFDGTVTSNPYEKGLLWDRVQKERKDSGLRVSIRNGGLAKGMNTLFFAVLDKTDRPLGKASVSVTVSRPSTTAYDRTYNCAKTDYGSWRANVDFPLYGYWDLNIHVLRGLSDISFTKQVFVQK